MSPQPVFRAVELMDMAVQIEEHGRAFYEACLSATENKELKDVFRYLLNQEIEHARVFSRMKQERGEEEVLPESYPGEMRRYLDAFVEGEIFDDPESATRKARGIEDPDEVIEAALAIEKQSILFYSGMKSLVRPSDAEDVDRIMAEEHNHVRRLLALRRDRTTRSSTG